MTNEWKCRRCGFFSNPRIHPSRCGACDTLRAPQWVLCTVEKSEPGCIIEFLKLRDDDYYSLCGGHFESGHLMFGEPKCEECLQEWWVRFPDDAAAGKPR